MQENQTDKSTDIDSINSEEISNKNSKNWLQRLKNESWEAELLVSAIAIYGTFQLFKLIVWTTNVFIDRLIPNQYLIGYSIVFFGLLAISILVSMFVIHFFLRAYWIGLVGLNSVFPDYSIKDSAYSEIYTRKMLNILPKLKDSIKKVDELCSVIFSAAFSVLLLYSYMALLSSIYLFLYNLLTDYIPYYILLFPAQLFGLILIFQFIVGIIANLKGNKQNEKIQTLYFKVGKLSSIIGLGPLYKSILQITMIFASNFKKKKAMIKLIIAFFLSGMFLAIAQIGNTNIPYLIKTGKGINNDNNILKYSFYKTENKTNSFLLTPEIESDIIKNGILKVFIPIFNHEKTLQKNICDPYTKDENKSKQEQRSERDLYRLDCYKKYNKVFLNGKVTNNDYMKYFHPKTGQFGVLCYVKLTNALDGKNILTIKKEYGNENDKEWAIPFYYSPKSQ